MRNIDFSIYLQNRVKNYEEWQWQNFISFESSENQSDQMIENLKTKLYSMSPNIY